MCIRDSHRSARRPHLLHVHQPVGSAGPYPGRQAQGLNAELQKTLARPDVQDKLATRGAIVETGSAAQFDAFNRAEISKWTQVIKDAGIQAD